MGLRFLFLSRKNNPNLQLLGIQGSYRFTVTVLVNKSSGSLVGNLALKSRHVHREKSSRQHLREPVHKYKFEHPKARRKDGK